MWPECPISLLSEWVYGYYIDRINPCKYIKEVQPMKRNKFKTLAVSGLVVAATALTSISAMAVDVNVNSPFAKVQQKVVLEKTEAVVPSFTVEIPATVKLASKAQDLTYTLNLESDTDFVPKGKKVSVTIDSAGYYGTLDKFAVWDKKNLNEASYEIYFSDVMKGGRYKIGDEIVSWDGSNHGTQTRRIAVKDYNHVEPGTYNGVINYGIALKDKA